MKNAPRRATGALLFAVGLALATGLTFWLGFRATREWQRSTIEAAETRGNEVVTLLDVALERDMKGGQLSVLLPFNQVVLNSAPYDLADRFARGFARFPYLESFFVWTNAGGADGTTYVFSRADRRPGWDDAEGADDPYPVVFRRDPGPLRPVVARARATSSAGSRFALLESSVAGVPYQTLAYLLYEGGDKTTLSGVVAQMVNLQWVRDHYFVDFIGEIQNVIGDTTVSLEIVDDQGRRIAAVGPPSPAGTRHVRSFPLVFADQALVPDTPRRQDVPVWTARVGVANEATLLAAARGTSRTLTLLGLGGLATLIGLAFTVRAARASAELAAVQSEFVSAVSHEMKTPLSLIRLASDTLANRRYASPDAIADYGRLMGVEAHRLTRLIDNVLCYARINDTSSAYALEPLDVVELVHESVDRFRPQLDGARFDVQLDLPQEPAFVEADHAMLAHVFDNLVDNATKYAASGAWLGVAIVPNGRQVRIEIADRGEGIPPDDLAHVFERFYRRKGTRERGTGLGLAIVRRIVEDHRGSVAISSDLGRGTRVVVDLPTVEG